MYSKNVGGRPLKFKTVQELQRKIESYFKSCWTIKLDMFGNPIYLKDKKGKKTNHAVMVQNKPYTITGLAVALDTDRATLMRYEAKDRFYNTIKKAKEVCHAFAEEFLYSGKAPAGAIFGLKNNWGWQDRMETDITSGGEPIPILGKNVDVILKNNSNKKTVGTDK